MAEKKTTDGGNRLQLLENQVALATTGYKVIDIVFGVPEQPATKDVPPKDVWSINYAAQGKPYRINENISVSEIALKEWGTDLFFVEPSKMSGEGTNYRPYYKNGVGLYYFFPLIMLDTYKRSQMDKSYRFNPDSPDTVYLGCNVSVPNITLSVAKSMIGNATYQNIFKGFQRYYEDRQSTGYAKAMHDIYMYLKWGSQ